MTRRFNLRLPAVLRAVSALPLAVTLLWGQPAATPESLVRDTFGSDVPVDLLPRDRNGQILSLERARAEMKTRRNIAVREAMRNYFPPQSKQTHPEWWRQTTDSQGRVHVVPNEGHPQYARFTADLDLTNHQIDTDYQQRYGQHYEAFSRAVFDNAPDSVQLIGRPQDRLFSDVDATFRNPAEREALMRSFEQAGFTIEQAPGDHGLYVKVKELDWVQWSNNTVEDLQREWDAAAHNPERQAEIGQRLQAAMRDKEVAATTVGARHALSLPGGSHDPMGASLDQLKKFAQSDDVYTKSKIACRLTPDDLSQADRTRRQNLGITESMGLFTEHAGEKRALRMEHLPLALQEDLKSEHVSRLKDEVVSNYRQAAIESYVSDRASTELRQQMLLRAAEHEDRGDLVGATTLRNSAIALEEQQRQMRRENNQTMREIARSDPDLYARLVVASEDALQNVARIDPADREVRDDHGRRTAVRDGWMTRENLQRFGAVAVDTTKRLSEQTGAVFDKVGKLGGYASVADEAFMLEAQGKGSAATHIAKTVAKDAAQDYVMDKLTQRFPKLGNVMEVMDIPTTVLAEMEAEMQKAEARGGSLWDAKARGVWNTMKKKTFIGTLEKALNEEGMAEVEREMATGNYSWTNVALRTATTTIGEVTQMNAALRFGNDYYYGVYDAQKAARLETEQLRTKLRGKTLSNEASLDALNAELIRLQLDPNVDDPIVAARIKELQDRFDDGVRGMTELGQKMRKQFGTTDRQVEDLYKRAQFARDRQKSELLEAKMTRLAMGRDPLNVETWIELKKVRADYREELSKMRVKTKKLLTMRGDANDPLVKEQLARFRRMRDTSNKIEAVKFDIRDQWQRENDAERERREKELQSYADTFKQNTNRLPQNLTADDYALVVEMDDLRIRQEDGEIAADADLVGMAIANVDRDMRYQELVRRQNDGEIPEDADLLAILDGAQPSDDQLDMEAFGETGDAPMDEAEQIEIEEFDAFADNPAARPVFYGTDGQDLPFGEPGYVQQGSEGPAPVHSAEPVVNGKRHGVHQSKDGNGRVYSETAYANGMIHGYVRHYDRNTFQLTSETYYHSDAKHGPERRFKNGQLVSETFYHAGQKHGPSRNYHENGQLAGESFNNAGLSQGPSRSFFEDGSPKSEKWYAEGHLHGWQREWNEQGNLRYERFGTRIDKRDYYFLERSYDRESGQLKSETFLDLGKPLPAGSSLKFPKLVRRYDSDGQVTFERRTLPDDTRFGVEISSADNKRTVTTYGQPGQRIAIRIEDLETGQLLEDSRYTLGDDGQERPHGVFTIYFPPDSPHAGQERLVAHYNRGILHGEYVEYDDDGELRRKGTFAEGSPHGSWQDFYKGHLTKDLNYRAGVLEGPQKFWAFNRGNSEPHEDMEADIRGDHVPRFAVLGTGRCRRIVGESTLQLKPVDPIKLAPQTRPSVGFSHPVPFSVHDLKNARVISGTLEEWFMSSGQKRMQLEESYRDGVLEGPRKAYYANGQLFVHENIRNGVLHGTCESWFYSGEKSSTVSFVNGLKHGTFKYRERKGYPETVVEAVNGIGLGWITSYQYQGNLSARTYYAKPSTPPSNLQPAKPHLDPPQRSTDACPAWAPNAQAWGDKIGPQIRYADNKPAKIFYYGYQPDGSTHYTEDVNEYLEWAAADNRLPTTVPGEGPLKATRKLNLASNRGGSSKSARRSSASSANPMEPPRGLSDDEAHTLMMDYWRQANEFTRDGDYMQAQQVAMAAAKLGRAYAKTEARAVVISYEKAALAAARSGEPDLARSYYDEAKRAAQELGETDMIDSINAKMAEL